MAGFGTPDPKRERDIDWSRTRVQIRDRIRAQLGPGDGSLDDLTQQALIELLRVVRREGAHHLDGLIVVVARTTVIDDIRRRQRERARSVHWDVALEQIERRPGPGSDPPDHAAELLWFTLLEFLRVHDSPCYGLALAYAQLGDWKHVAESEQRSYDATRQQWSRCVRRFRDALKRDPGPFKEWLDDA